MAKITYRMNSEKVWEFDLVIIFLIFPGNDNFGSKIKNFEISWNSAYLWLIIPELYSKYAKYADLYDHQVKRCKKRYVSNKWVVKIWFPENSDSSKNSIVQNRWYSPKERKISNTAKPKSHLWLSFISSPRYRVILVQNTSKTVTSIGGPKNRTDPFGP